MLESGENEGSKLVSEEKMAEFNIYAEMVRQSIDFVLPGAYGIIEELKND